MRSVLCSAVAGAVALSAAAGEPQGDCSTAAPRSIARLVCDSPALARLDAEQSRLFALATAPGAGASASAVRRQQPAWLAQREACAGSKTREACVRDLYLGRIAALRAQSRRAREAGGKGISLGPYAFRCEGLDAPLEITFVNADQGLAWITIKDQAYPLLQQRSGSGVRYEGDGTLFWEHQGEARWRANTGSPEAACRRSAAG